MKYGRKLQRGELIKGMAAQNTFKLQLVQAVHLKRETTGRNLSAPSEGCF